MTHYLSVNESQVNPLEVDEAAAASVLVGVIPAPPKPVGKNDGLGD